MRSIVRVLAFSIFWVGLAAFSQNKVSLGPCTTGSCQVQGILDCSHGGTGSASSCGGGLTGSGTANTLAMWVGSSALGNSPAVYSPTPNPAITFFGNPFFFMRNVSGGLNELTLASGSGLYFDNSTSLVGLEAGSSQAVQCNTGGCAISNTLKVASLTSLTTNCVEADSTGKFILASGPCGTLGAAITSINGDTTPAQVLAPGTGISITPGPAGTNTIAVTGGGGITDIALPVDTFTGTPCTGPTCTFGKANEAPYTVPMNPQNGSFLLPIIVNGCGSSGCYGTGSGAYSFTTVSAIPAGYFVLVSAVMSDNPAFGWCPTGDTRTITGLAVSDGVDTFNPVFVGINNGNDSEYLWQSATGVVGGSLTITVTGAGTASACAQVKILAIGNVSALDQKERGVSPALGAVTTTQDNEVVIGIVDEFNYHSDVLSAGLGWQSPVPFSNNATADQEGIAVSQIQNAVGTYTPLVNCSAGGCYGGPGASYVLSFESTAVGGPTGPWVWTFIPFPALTTAAFPGLAGTVAASTPGDTQVDLHVGTPIEVIGVTTLFAGNNAASQLAMSHTGGPSAYHCWVALNCHTSSDNTLDASINYTDTSNSPTSFDVSGVACNILPSNENASIPIYVYASSAIYLQTTLLAGIGSYSYDVHAVCELANTR